MKNEVEYLKRGYVWNTFASIAAGSSSVILLMVVRRCCSIELAASFSVAIAVVNLTINIGHLNMYGYQISDIKEEFSFKEYLVLRASSVFLMLLATLIFTIYRRYETDKSLLIMIYCLYRGLFAFFDLFQGRYQQKGRIDLSAKFNFFRILIPDGIIALSVLFLLNLNVAIVFASIALSLYSLIYTHRSEPAIFRLQHKGHLHVFCLLYKCMPVFYYAFVNTYILNSPKYVIDYYMDDKARFYYAILLLPATTIHMVLGFVYRPILTVFATLWDRKCNRELNKRIARIDVLAVGILTTILLFVRPVLIPILKLLYNVQDLNNYYYPFCILLVAGGMQAITTLYSFLITIIRGQKHFIWIYTIVLGLAVFIPILLVKRYGFVGAAFSYLILSLIQMMMVVWVYYYEERKVSLSV